MQEIGLIKCPELDWPAHAMHDAIRSVPTADARTIASLVFIKSALVRTCDCSWEHCSDAGAISLSTSNIAHQACSLRPADHAMIAGRLRLNKSNLVVHVNIVSRSLGEMFSHSSGPFKH